MQVRQHLHTLNTLINEVINMSEQSITQSRLKELLNYNPDSGEFTWKSTSSQKSRVTIGGIAGGVTGNGYVRIKLDCKKYMAHRLAWLYVHGRWPDQYIDHINLNKADNRICNLREATHSQNLSNRRSIDGSSSRFLGVCFDKKHKAWVSKIGKNGSKKYLGAFQCEVEAARAYDRAARVIHGEFARLNFAND